ncbi:hypothetical protein MKEN_00311900 [Mycena kentingensis (nom. inval.)]|nr:hypothetical protein MKEN_00311900 [Mycena kentingensis (nom. inval.)]
MASADVPPPLPPNVGQITTSQLLGTMLNFFLFGTLFIQVYVYKLCFPKDRPAIKALVSFVFISMLVCTCLNAADLQRWYGSGYGDLRVFIKTGFSPFYTPLMGSVIGLVVQLFFCYRITVFRANSWTLWWACAIAAVSFMQAAGGMGGGLKSYIAANQDHDKARTILVYMWLVGSAVADVAIAVTMTYLLSQASEPQTRDIVHGVIQLIIETNSFSASVAIIGLVLFAGLPTTNYFICPTMVLPGIYANTLLVLLNNRAAPSRSRLHPVSSRSGEPDVVYGSSGTSTAQGTSVGHLWKAMPTSPGVQLQKLDYNAPGKGAAHGGRVVDIGPGAFVAAPNPAYGNGLTSAGEDDYDYDHKRGYSYDAYGTVSPYTPSPPVTSVSASTTAAPQRQNPNSRHLVSEWDDASYRTGERRTRWESNEDGGEAELSEVETHPYGNGGNYTVWAR